jgi:DNA-binding transcriptional ArsR family regulator
MNVEIALSPQFDLCYALADLASPNPHFTDWPNVDASLIDDARAFGWAFWLGLPDLVDFDQPPATVDEFIQALADIAPAEVVLRLHRTLVQQPTSQFVNARSREWLHYIGLDGGEPDADRDARWGGPMDAPLAVLNRFRRQFDRVWAALLPELKESAAQASTIAGTDGLAGLASELTPDVEFDERAAMMRTAKGYRMPLTDVGTLFLLPSVFNSRRFKTATEFSTPRRLYIPYLLEELELPLGLRRTADFGIDFDPWLACRAIGNPTRASILQLIAERPRAAFEIQRELGLSKANVSHHIFQLREAGLITEKRAGRKVELAIRLQSFRGLSRALTRELTPSGSMNRSHSTNH